MGFFLLFLGFVAISKVINRHNSFILNLRIHINLYVFEIFDIFMSKWIQIKIIELIAKYANEFVNFPVSHAIATKIDYACECNVDVRVTLIGRLHATWVMQPARHCWSAAQPMYDKRRGFALSTSKLNYWWKMSRLV